MSEEKRNAGEEKSGNAVAHSAPVLRQPTLPATAGRKPEASLHSVKSGRELEGSALIGGAAAVPPSLDKEQNNRDKPHDPFRHRHCGGLSLRGISGKSPTSQKFVKVTCKCWGCERCGPRKALRYRWLIGEIAEARRLGILLTLTLDPEKLNGKDSIRHINQIFAHFRTYLKRQLGHSPEYIRILEFQKNGTAHLHILLNDYIPQRWISNAWAALGGGPVVDIRRVKLKAAARYVSKYLTKDMLLSAPKRCRRVTTSRGIKLNPKIHGELLWSLVSVPIERLFDVYWQTATNVTRDVEGNVTGFDLTLKNGMGTR